MNCPVGPKMVTLLARFYNSVDPEAQSNYLQLIGHLEAPSACAIISKAENNSRVNWDVLHVLLTCSGIIASQSLLLN